MSKITVIAEIGLNHGGDLGKAKAMIEAAKKAGADIAKFQWYKPELILRDSPHLEEAKRCQFSWKQHLELRDHCKKIGIEWCVSAFHQEQVDLLAGAGMSRFKIASRAATDTELLHKIAKTGRPVIISTGLLNRAGIEGLGPIFRHNQTTLLYCVCDYPTKIEDVHFDRMLALKNYCPNIGFSSHCPDIAAALSAVRHGATCIEQHVLFDKNQQGCDVSSSITFQDLKILVDIVNPGLIFTAVKEPEHVEWLRVQRSRPELYRYFRQDAPITEDQQRRWWKSLDKNTVRLFIIELPTGEKIGYAGFNPFNLGAGRAEFGIFVLPQFQKQRYGTRIMRMLLRKGFEEYGLSTIYSDVINYPNEHLFDFYKKLGFVAFPPEHQTMRYRKQNKMIPSIKFFMTGDMYGKNHTGGLEPVPATTAV